MIKRGFYFLLMISFLGCGDDADNGLEKKYTDIDVVTGLDFYDFNGAPIGTWGIPNHNPGEVICFPIPAGDVVSIISDDIISKIYLVFASCLLDSTSSNIPENSMSLDYNTADLEEAKLSDFENPAMSISLQLNLSILDEGLYRLFFELASGELYWQNIYVDPNVTQIPNLAFLEDLCN